MVQREKITWEWKKIRQETRFPILIAFSGTVGSGKSTQMRLLASALSKHGLKVRTCSMQTNHLLGRIFALLLARISLSRAERDIFKNIIREKSVLRALLARRPDLFRRLFTVWLTLDFLSVLILELVNIRLPLKFGFIVLVEEYLPATIVNYAYLHLELFGHISRSLTTVIAFLLRLMCRNGLMVVFLDANDKTLKNRWHASKTLNEYFDYVRIQRLIPILLKNVVARRPCSLLLIDNSHLSVFETHKMITQRFHLVHRYEDRSSRYQDF